MHGSGTNAVSLVFPNLCLKYKCQSDELRCLIIIQLTDRQRYQSTRYVDK